MNLETKRLILRAWQESDAEALYKYARNPNIGPIAGWQPHTSVENSREIIKTVLSAPEIYAVVLKETGETVGGVGIIISKNRVHSARIAENECEMGYWIGEPFWGQGLIPEAVNELLKYAFEVLRQSAVWCGYYNGNEKSKRVQEKCGFTYSHTEYNKHVPLMNDFRTEHYTKLTVEDWIKAKGTYIVLLRGVMPKGKNSIPKMSYLKENLEKSHFHNVRTYIQSGNIVLQTALSPLEISETVHIVIKENIGADLMVIVKTADEISEILHDNPFTAGYDIARVFFTLFNSDLDVKMAEELVRQDFGEEQFAYSSKACYMYLPQNAGRSRLSNNFLEKKLKIGMTTRNYNTLSKLVAMANER